MAFKDWFGVAIESLPAPLRALKPRRCIMVRRQPSSRKITKSFPATVYMSDQFPLSVSLLSPRAEHRSLMANRVSAFGCRCRNFSP
jgi:hypothetical protein